MSCCAANMQAYKHKHSEIQEQIEKQREMRKMKHRTVLSFEAEQRFLIARSFRCISIHDSTQILRTFCSL